MRPIVVSLFLSAAAGFVLMAAPAQSPSLMPIDEVRPGMVGVGRTVYAGTTLDEFRVHIIGVMRNVVGPKRDLILARLEGGPLASTGVMQGMSGSPVYIDDRLIGAVSYSIGSFPKEPIAGITPIAEMIDDVTSRAPRSAASDLAINWPAQPAQVFEGLARVARRAMAPLGPIPAGTDIVGSSAVGGLAPMLRPIGAAIAMSGFEPTVAEHLRTALDASTGQVPGDAAPAQPHGGPLRPGDPVGMSLVRGDFEMGATGTVTHVDGPRVYAFGHPFLGLGPTQVAMTEAHVLTVLPSLSSSMKLASMGRVIGTMTQDRATVVGGMLGSGPRELAVHLTLSSARGAARTFEFHVANDPTLTPLFTYVALYNGLTAYERQAGVLSLSATGTLTLGDGTSITIDDAFAGERALTDAANAIAMPLGTLMPNRFREVRGDELRIEIQTSEVEEYTTIERVWLDTVRPRAGNSYAVQVQLQDFRGESRVVSIPVAVPPHTSGPLTLMVADAAATAAWEQRELRPEPAGTWDELLRRTNDTRRHNRIYVRLIASGPGTVLGGDTLPSLPASRQAAIATDKTAGSHTLTRHLIGTWEHRLDRPVRGSHELTITPEPAR